MEAPGRDEQQLLITGSLLVIATVAGSAALYWTSTVMIPFVVALLLSYLVSPLVDFLQIRLRAPRLVAVFAAGVVLAGILALVLWLGFLSVQNLMVRGDVYERRLLQIFDWGVAELDGLGIDVGQDAVLDAVRGLPIMGWVQSTVGSLVGLASNGFLVALFLAYLVLGTSPARPEARGLWGEIDLKIRRYLIVKVGVSAVTGVSTFLVLWVLGLDLALVFGMAAFLLNFIPSVGSVIATLLPLPIALVQLDSPWMMAAVIVLPGSVQFLFGNVIEPKMLGDSLDLHPITVVIALMFWGLIWGIVGMLMAAPLTAVLRIVLERFDTTRPIAGLLAGRLPDL